MAVTGVGTLERQEKIKALSLSTERVKQGEEAEASESLRINDGKEARSHNDLSMQHWAFKPSRLLPFSYSILPLLLVIFKELSMRPLER